MAVFLNAVALNGIFYARASATYLCTFDEARSNSFVVLKGSNFIGPTSFNHHFMCKQRSL